MNRLSDTLYAKYVKERENAEILENEFGFVKYVFLNNQCHISDMYVVPEKRASGAGHALQKQLEIIALKNGCEILTADIQLNDPGHMNTLAAAGKTGFQVTEAQGRTLFIAKKLIHGGI